jgi:hypothetical protein
LSTVSDTLFAFNCTSDHPLDTVYRRNLEKRSRHSEQSRGMFIQICCIGLARPRKAR